MPDAATGTTAAGWFPALTTLVGFVTGSLLELFRDRRTTQREREARQEVKRAQLLERRGAFQRETLINLQNAIVKLARAAGSINYLNEMHLRETGKWGGFLFPEELNNDAHEANVTVMVLTSRLRDGHLRELVSNFRTHTSQIGTARTRELEIAAFDGVMALLPPIHERIGEILRRLDDDEDTNAATG